MCPGSSTKNALNPPNYILPFASRGKLNLSNSRQRVHRGAKRPQKRKTNERTPVSWLGRSPLFSCPSLGIKTRPSPSFFLLLNSAVRASRQRNLSNSHERVHRGAKRPPKGHPQNGTTIPFYSNNRRTSNISFLKRRKAWSILLQDLTKHPAVFA